MSPAQIVRFARNKNLLRSSDQKHDIEMAWLNAALQRAKKMPSIKKLTESANRKAKRRPRLADIVAYVDKAKKVSV